MEKLVLSMCEVLGTAMVLYMTTHGFHWNVEGPNFFELHKLLDDQYNDIWASLDDHAEHIRALDAYAPQTMTQLLKFSRLQEAPNGVVPARDMLLFLIEGHETLIDLMNEVFAMANEENQQGLTNFLGARIEAHQKMRWMLRASAKPTV